MSLIKSHTYKLLPWLFSASMGDLVYSALTQMPLGALFCKMIPDKVETSMFALCTCLTSVSRVTTPIIGGFFAQFIDSTLFFPAFYKLFGIQAAFAVVSLVSVMLVPLRADVSKVQACMEYMRKAESLQTPSLLEEYKRLDQKVADRLAVLPPEGASPRSEVARSELEEAEGLIVR